MNFEVYDGLSGETTSLNGITRNQTDANIRKHFGSIEDFSVSSLASQHGSLAFIDEGSTRRKEIIAKFLDLEVFEKKFRLAKEDSVDMKVLLKKHQDRNYDDEIEEVEIKLRKYHQHVSDNKELCTTFREELKTLQASVATLEETISSIPNEYIDIVRLIALQKERKITIASLYSKIIEDSKDIDIKKQEVSAARKFVTATDFEALEQQQIEIQEIKEKEEEVFRRT